MQRFAAFAVFALFACTPAASAQEVRSAEAAPLIEFRLVHEEPAADIERVEYEDEVRPLPRSEQLLLDLELNREGAQAAVDLSEEEAERSAQLIRARWPERRF